MHLTERWRKLNWYLILLSDYFLFYTTLLSEIFVRRKFRGFAIFLPDREISIFFVNREISFREFLKIFWPTAKFISTRF